MKRNKLFTAMLIVASTAMASTASAQVKIGTNPTVISSNSNLEVEATNNYPVVIQKNNGYVGINTLTPNNLLHVSGSSPTEGVSIDLKNATSSIYLSTDGGITVKRVGSSKTFASHVGGYLDLTGQTGGSLGWRFAQYAAFLGIGPIPESNINAFPLNIFNDGSVRIGSTTQLGNAKLTVAGQVAAQGFCTREGILGTVNGNNFNISWNGTNANLWIDNANYGIISLTSDYRLKKNITASADNAIERVKSLKPVSFEYKSIAGDIFKSDRKVHEGFIAHELQAVIPSAVNGKKDALTADGKIQPQTLNPMPVISLLAKAIQEQQVEIEALQRENKTLKSQSEEIASLIARLAKVEQSMQVSSNKNISSPVSK
jgi:hypothetical protein